MLTISDIVIGHVFSENVIVKYPNHYTPNYGIFATVSKSMGLDPTIP
jgi:hypothetical protein